MNPKCWAIFLSYFIFPVFLYGQIETIHGTIILLYGDSSGITVAADSRSVDDNSKIISDSVCKITVFGDNVIFLYSGIYEGFNGFNVLKTATECYRANRTPSQLAMEFEIKVNEEIYKLLDTIRNIDTNSFNKSISQTGFEYIWIINNGGDIFVDKYTIKPPTYKSKTSFSGGEGKRWHQKDGVFWDAIGIDGFCKSCITTQAATNFFHHYGVENGMRRFIETEIGFDSIDIGGQVNILAFDKRGIHWKDRKPYCKQCEICPPTK